MFGNRDDKSISLLHNLASFASTEGLPEKVASLLRPIKEPIKDLELSLHKRECRIAFFGSFKAGKTTIINRLIGYNLLPSRANRATGVITRIGYATQPCATVLERSRSGQLCKKNIDLGEISKYVLLDLSGRTAIAPEGVEEVLINLPIPITSNNLSLIDTPGLMDNEELTERTFSELERADLAVMVLSADKILSVQERRAARRVHDLLNGNILFFINRLNLVGEEEQQEIIETTRHILDGMGNNIVGRPRLFAAGEEVLFNNGQKSVYENVSQYGLGGLVEFEEWLNSLWNSPSGERILLLSRLGRVGKHLSQARSYFENQLAEIHVALRRFDALETEAHFESLKSFKAKVKSAEQSLGLMKCRIGEFCEKFLNDCQQRVSKTMERDDWASGLNDCFQSALKEYSDNIQKRVREYVCGLNLSVPVFDLCNSNIVTGVTAAEDSSGVAGAWIGGILGAVTLGIGAVVTAPLGYLIGKTLFGNDIKQETLTKVRESANSILPHINFETNCYLSRVEISLREHEQRHQPKRSISASHLAAKQSEQLYKRLIDQCSELQRQLEQAREEILS